LIAERGTNYVYHYNAIAPWKIAENGEVTNVYAAGA
jgi:sulfane dehydrogenase subunit SoxC